MTGLINNSRIIKVLSFSDYNDVLKDKGKQDKLSLFEKGELKGDFQLPRHPNPSFSPFTKGRWLPGTINIRIETD